MVVANLILACSKESDKPLTGDDIVDITANKWLNQVNNRDLLALLRPMFYGSEDNAKDFLLAIRGMKPTQITEKSAVRGFDSSPQ